MSVFGLGWLREIRKLFRIVNNLLEVFREFNLENKGRS